MQSLGASYLSQRSAAFNDMAVEIIRKERGTGKYVARVGEDHLLRSSINGTPGMGAVLEVPAISIRDDPELKAGQCRLISWADPQFKTPEGRNLFRWRNKGTTVGIADQPGRDVLVEVNPESRWEIG